MFFLDEPIVDKFPTAMRVDTQASEGLVSLWRLEYVDDDLSDPIFGDQAFRSTSMEGVTLREPAPKTARSLREL